MVKPTIVTMFFNLKNLQDTTAETRSPEFYLEKGEGTLSIESPMVIFCDCKTKYLIKPIRDRCVDPDTYPTIYIEKNIEDYDIYKNNWSYITEYRQKNNKPNSRNTASYLLTMMMKFIGLKIAEERNDFNSSHYFWIDFGIQHVAGSDMIVDIEPVLANPKPKVGLLYIHYHNDVNLRNIKICDSGFGCVANTFFTVEKAYVPKLYSLAMSIFYEMLFNETGHNDEQVMAYCYDRHPEMFIIHYGDYYSVISNYFVVKRDWHCIRHLFVDSALSCGRNDLAAAAAKSVMEGLHKNYFTIPDHHSEYTNLFRRVADM
jgi:hypothetical protein